MKKIITKAFIEGVNEIFKDKHDEVRRHILNHPAKEKMIENLLGQFKGVERARIKLSKEKIIKYTKDFVKTFGGAAIAEKEKELGKDIIKDVAEDEGIELRDL